MTKIDPDQEYKEYLAEVHRMWIPAKYGVAWTIELAKTMYKAEFLIDNVMASFDRTGEPSGQAVTEWHGRCYDADNACYRFIAKWVFNWDEFSHMFHYYDLDDLYVRPEEESDKGNPITRTEEQIAQEVENDRALVEQHASRGRHSSKLR